MTKPKSVIVTVRVNLDTKRAYIGKKRIVEDAEREIVGAVYRVRFKTPKVWEFGVQQ